jgi:malate dehydrogenase (oxaloacetate-decarboxylating)
VSERPDELISPPDGLAQVEPDDPVQQVHEAMWRPEHPRVEAV